MSKSYNGLSTFSEDVSNNEDMKYFVRLYLLLYADDTFIFAESPEEIQIAPDL